LNDPVIVDNTIEVSKRENNIDDSTISKLAKLGKQRKNECNG
jgi:hypothetical protein